MSSQPSSSSSTSKVGEHAWVLVFLIGVVLYIAVERALASTANPNFVPSLLLLGALLVPVTFVTYVYGRNTSWTMPLHVLGLAALFGGVIGVVTAGVLEYDSLRKLGTVPTILVGLIEESVKLIVPIVLLVFVKHRKPADGMVVGVTVGMSFAALETMGYGFTTLLQSNLNIGDVENELFARGLLSPAGHAAWTGLACTALYRAVDAHGRNRSIQRFIGWFVLVVVLHGLWDALGAGVSYLVLGLISLGLLRIEMRRTQAVAA